MSEQRNQRADFVVGFRAQQLEEYDFRIFVQHNPQRRVRLESSVSPFRRLAAGLHMNERRKLFKKTRKKKTNRQKIDHEQHKRDLERMI